MKTIKAYFGLSHDGTRVSPGTSIMLSLALSILVSMALRFLFPAASYPLRLGLWAVAMFVIFRWAGANAEKQRTGSRRDDG